MVGVEDRNEDVAKKAPRPSSVPDAAAPVSAPSAEDGGVIFVLEKASLEATKVGKVKKTKEIPSPFLFWEEGGEFFFRRVICLNFSVAFLNLFFIFFLLGFPLNLFFRF
jgi:hypothetical protein